jgi:hypothetical protein
VSYGRGAAVRLHLIVVYFTFRALASISTYGNVREGSWRKSSMGARQGKREEHSIQVRDLDDSNVLDDSLIVEIQCDRERSVTSTSVVTYLQGRRIYCFPMMSTGGLFISARNGKSFLKLHQCVHRGD